MNRTVVEHVQTMLADAELPDTYWWEALQYVVLPHNISPTHDLRGMYS